MSLVQLAELEILSRQMESERVGALNIALGGEAKQIKLRDRSWHRRYSLIYSVTGRARQGLLIPAQQMKAVQTTIGQMPCVIPTLLGRFGKMIANGLPSVRSHDPAVAASAHPSGALG